MDSAKAVENDWPVSVVISVAVMMVVQFHFESTELLEFKRADFLPFFVPILARIHH